jgi:hypothetical protein
MQARINYNTQIIQLNSNEAIKQNKLWYKEELDRQRAQRDSMMAYGNMSQAEK